MTAYNVVRNRVKSAREKHFEHVFKSMKRDYSGLRKMAVVNTGERTYCLIGE